MHCFNKMAGLLFWRTGLYWFEFLPRPMKKKIPLLWESYICIIIRGSLFILPRVSPLLPPLPVKGEFNRDEVWRSRISWFPQKFNVRSFVNEQNFIVRKRRLLLLHQKILLGYTLTIYFYKVFPDFISCRIKYMSCKLM